MHQKRKNERVFVTGASGFVGANLTRSLLAKGYDVHILYRDNTTNWRLKNIQDKVIPHKGDITDKVSLQKALTKIQPNYIIHLATYGAYHYQNDFTKAIQTNIIGTANLLEASREIPYKCFINTGSSSEYGFKDTPMKETDFCDPISYYAATKLAATNLCKVFAQVHNKPIVTFRLFSVYGPYEEAGRLVPNIMTALLRKEPISLSSADQRRDFIYVEDVCTAYIQALHLGKRLQASVLNIATGGEYTNNELVQKLFEVTQKQTTIFIKDTHKRIWDAPHWVADVTKTKELLDFSANHTIDKGLQSTYAWFEKYADTFYP